MKERGRPRHRRAMVETLRRSFRRRLLLRVLLLLPDHRCVVVRVCARVCAAGARRSDEATRADDGSDLTRRRSLPQPWRRR